MPFLGIDYLHDNMDYLTLSKKKMASAIFSDCRQRCREAKCGQHEPRFGEARKFKILDLTRILNYAWVGFAYPSRLNISALRR